MGRPAAVETGPGVVGEGGHTERVGWAPGRLLCRESSSTFQRAKEKQNV